MSWIQTYTGRKFWPCNPQMDDVELRDICHALSMKCRFNGHCRRFYSVADHSIRVAELFLDRPGCTTKQEVLAVLLHDAAEAYLPDVCRPIKPQLAGFRELESLVLGVVLAHFDLPYQAYEVAEMVRPFDDILLMTEARDLMGEPPEPWSVEAEPLPEIIIPRSQEQGETDFGEMFERWCPRS